MSSPITVLSSYSKDILVNAQDEVIAEQSGGPAMFIEQTLLAERLPYTVLTNDKVEVEILVSSAGEFGKVETVPQQNLILNESLSNWTIVSTILDEWSFTQLTTLPKRLFIDVQGYVRKAGDFGQKQRWDMPSSLVGRVFCLKGTAEEIDYLPKNIVENQKTRMLIITSGDKGAEVFYQNSRAQISPNKVATLKNYIGAGDTFLAYVVASMYRGNSPKAAVAYASEQTTKFLEQNLQTY